MKVVNLFGGPGTGKSTTCAALFAELKYRDYDVEMVREFAKDLVWAGRQPHMRVPGFILGEQSYRLATVAPKVVVTITDSPILLSRVYDSNEAQKQLALDVYNQYENLNIFLQRKKAYNPNGRNETEGEAHQKDREIREMLNELNLDYTLLAADRDAVHHIVDILRDKEWIQ